MKQTKSFALGTPIRGRAPGDGLSIRFEKNWNRIRRESKGDPRTNPQSAVGPRNQKMHWNSLKNCQTSDLSQVLWPADILWVYKDIWNYQFLCWLVFTIMNFRKLKASHYFLIIFNCEKRDALKFFSFYELNPEHADSSYYVHLRYFLKITAVPNPLIRE